MQKMLPPQGQPQRPKTRRPRRRSSLAKPLVEPGQSPGSRYAWTGGTAGDDEPGFGGHKVSMGRVVSSDGRHSLGSIAFCSRCGAFFWRRTGCLAGDCTGAARNGQASRLRRGCFPSYVAAYADLKVVDVRPPRAPEAAELSRQLSSARELRSAAAGRGVKRLAPVAPARRLRRKTGAVAERQQLADAQAAILAAYGLPSQAAWSELTTRWQLLRSQQQRQHQQSVERNESSGDEDSDAEKWL